MTNHKPWSEMTHLEREAYNQGCADRAKLVATLREFVRANNEGPATQWAHLIVECYKRADALLRELGELS
jgi:hypothetical protein